MAGRKTIRLPEIGFVWLCFSGPPTRLYFHNTLPRMTLPHFGLAQIGFVFSNRAPSKALVPDLELVIQGFPPKAGDWL
ncbi:MAG: hypothetical protein JSU70_04615 [Phycisphaerales bacterium]|nr:MAG: hypothetical protein JSU70_04615 [Phycisphaerales bacterium]